jgi:rod shape-determining protein MreC
VFIVLALLLTTVWFREGASGPIHRVRLTVQAASSPVGAVGEFVTRPVRGVFSWASDLGVSRSQFEALRSQNSELRTRVASLEEARLENIRLQALIGLVQASKLQGLGARVIGRPTEWERVITIDRGTADGVKAGMPVVGAAKDASSTAGLLGQTTDVTAHSAKVRLISDQSSGVASMLQTNRVEGVARGSIDGAVTLEFISHETTVKAGDVVITSGMGGVYPKGLLVGEVVKVSNPPASLYQDIGITPAADLNGLEEVVVLVGAGTSIQTGGGE